MSVVKGNRMGKRRRKKVTTITTLHHMPFIALQKRASSVSVVFDFNASTNDVASVYLKPLPVDVNQHKWVKHLFDNDVLSDVLS